MSDPEQERQKPGDLDLDPETVRDLESSEDAEDVRGGQKADSHRTCVAGPNTECV